MTRIWRPLLAVGLLCGLLVAAPATASPVAAQAAGSLTASKAAPGELLAGEELTYSITASNPSTTPYFNVTYRDVLPLGVTYAGPTTPSAAGEPEIVEVDVTEPVSGATVTQQILIWSNVADLQPNSDVALSFAVDVNSTGDPARDDVHVIGAAIENQSEVYASTDARVVPRFDATGVLEPNPAVQTSVSSTASTTLTAVSITKTSDIAPEGELLRGVHDHRSRYELEIDVTELGNASDIVVTDLLPPQLEFLGCGGDDNSTTAGGQRPEYPGAPTLDAGRTLAEASCIEPTTVETQPDGSTLLTWTGLPPLTDPDAPLVISYLAGVPLFANAPFPAGTAPTPESGEQGSNLDNNTGASTREQPPATGGEQGAANTATVTGTFDDAGLLEPGVDPDVSDDDTNSVSIEDVRIRKEIVAPGDGVFSTGGISTYRITIDASEYMDASEIVLTDTIPNGMCPLVQLGFSGYPTISPAEDAAGCSQTSQPTIDGASFDAVAVDALAGGGYELVFESIPALAASGTTVVEYSAFMRGFYQGGDFDGRPTVGGDTFTNSVGSTATTDGISPGLDGFDPSVNGTLPGVEDGSSATLTTGSVQLRKELLPRNVAPRLDLADPAEFRCPDRNTGEPGTTDDQYVLSRDQPRPDDADQLGFRLGDQICFRLRVDFDTRSQTRNAVVTDFLPLGTTYVADSVRSTGANTVDFELLPGQPPEVLAFEIGDDVGGIDYVEIDDQVFEVVFAVEVVDVPDPDSPLLTGNLMKMRTENSLGQAQSFRDEANFGIVPAPPVGVTKGVLEVDTPESGPNGVQSNVDGSTVQQGSNVTFRIDLENLGTVEDFTDYSVRRIEVLDVLPDEVDCDDVSDIVNFGAPSDLGVCLDPSESVPASGSVPAFTNGQARSVIRWAFDGSDTFALFPTATGGEVRSLTYTLTIPTPTSVSTRFDNTAGVRSYGAFTNLENVTSPDYVPENNIDPSLNADTNAPEARDPSFVVLADAEVDKFVTSWIGGETGNNFWTRDPLPTSPEPIVGDRAQAVIGEYVTYRYFLDIPARSTVYSGRLTDTLPANLVIETAPPAPIPVPSLTFYPDASSPTAAPSPPAGVTFAPATGLVEFGDSYTNDTPTDQRFEVVISARVVAGNLNQTAQPGRENTVRFTSNAGPGNAPALDAVTATARVDIRQPWPDVTKAVSDSSVVGNDVVTYTLGASTRSGRPPLHDAWLEDCVPVGLQDVALVPSAGPTIGPLTGPDAQAAGCATGETYVAFGLGTLQPGAAEVTRQYTARVSLDSVGGQEYENEVELTGSSLNDGNATPGDDNPDERVYADTDDVTITVLGADVVKSVDPGTATIGERVEFTIELQIPPNTNYFQAAIVDRLPLGLVDPLPVGSPTCLFVDTPPIDPPDTCSVPLVGVLGPVDDVSPAPPLQPARVFGLYFGDIAAESRARNVELTYSARVADVPGNVAGVDLVNTAQPRWDLSEKADPTTPLNPWDVDGTLVSATMGVIEPDVVVAKLASDDTPEPGQEFGYTITATNVGTSTAFDTVVVDQLPDGVVLIQSATAPLSPDPSATVSPDGKTITWNLGELSIDEVRELTYRAVLAPSADIGASTPADDFTNTVQVTGYRSLPDDATNPDIRDYTGDPVDEVVEAQFPELDVTKDVLTPEPAYLGEPVTWRVTVENVGGGEAFAVDVVDVLPRSWEYEAGSTTIERPGPDLDRDPDISTAAGVQTLEWPNLGSLGPGESLTVTFRAAATQAVVEPPLFPGGSQRQVNDAAASALDSSGAPGNLDGPYEDADEASTRIDEADVVVEKNNAAAPAVAGEDHTWDVIVRNDGPDTAVGPFVVTDTLPVIAPDPATFVSATGAGWTCSESAGTVTCTRTDPDETLAPGAAFPAIEVTVAIPSDYLGELTNSVSVTSRTYDEDLTNNSDDATVTVTDVADLEIEKNRVETDIVAGRTVTYTLDVTNNGPSTSRATITVTDTLPANTTFVSAPTAAAGDPWDCVEAAGVVTCTLLEGTTRPPVGDLLANTAAPQIAITVLVDADAPPGVGLTNTAEVVPGATTDPDLDDNTDTDTGTVATVADLAIDKQATGELVAGQPATYRLRVDNLGPSDAAAPVITDTLPTGLTYTSFVSNPVAGGVGTWACTPGAGNTSFECVLDGPLPVGEFAVVDVTVDVDPSVTGTIVNTARVDSTTPDPVPDNNEDDDSSPFDVEADLTIAKTAPADPVVAGSPFQYNLQVTNLGPSTSVAPITVTDALPAGVEYLGYDDGGDWTCSAVPATQPGVSFVVTCVLGVDVDPSVDGGAAPPLVLDVQALPGAGPATLDNVAGVQGTTFDPDLDNNSDDAPVTLVDGVDVQVVKTPETQTVRAGESATFTLQVTNNGPSTADDVTVTDTLPSGMTLAAPVDAAPWTCTTPTPAAFSCNLATLAPGDAAPITFAALVGPGVPDGTTLVNATSVTTSSPDTDPSNDDDTADAVVVAEADLAITKSHGIDPVLAGDDVEFTIQVENLGPSDAAADVVVDDTLPDGFSFVSVAGPWTCAPDATDPQDVTCTFLGGGLAAGTVTGDLVMTVAVGADVVPGSYDNVASVSSPTTDPNPDNDVDTETVDVVVAADVSIVKTHDPAAVVVGEELVFTLAVRNDGPSDAQGVVVTDTIPAGLAFVSAAGAGDPSTWDCAASVAPDVSCSLIGPLPAGQSAEPILVTVTVLPEAYPGVDNTAVVESTTPDPDTSNNSSTDSVVVPPLTDLSITKEHTGDVQVGGRIEYTIVVTNSGPTPDPGVITITDDLPAALAPVSATGDGLTCAITGQLVTCTADEPLAVDASLTLTIVAEVLPAAYPEVTNVVTVATDSIETDLANNESTDTAPVAPLIALGVVKTLEEISVGSATWSLTVTNLGPNDTIEPIVLVDDLPVGLTFVSITGDGWVCSNTGQLVECTYDAVVVAGGAAPALTLVTTVSAPPGTEVVNAVTVSGGGPDVSEVSDAAAGVVPPPLPATGGDTSQPIHLALMALAAGVLLQLLAWFRRPRRVA